MSCVNATTCVSYENSILKPLDNANVSVAFKWQCWTKEMNVVKMNNKIGANYVLQHFTRKTQVRDIGL